MFLASIISQVNNTDAEGRLTLADALVYATNQGVEKVVLKHFIVFSSHPNVSFIISTTVLVGIFDRGKYIYQNFFSELSLKRFTFIIY